MSAAVVPSSQSTSFYYVLYGDASIARLGVAVKCCVHQALANESFFDFEPLAMIPRPMPVECCCLFTPKLRQSNMPQGVLLEDLLRIAHQLIVHGWELAEREAVDTSRNLDAVTEDAVPGLAALLAVLRVQLPDMERVLSRCLLEGQFAYNANKKTQAAVPVAA